MVASVRPFEEQLANCVKRRRFGGGMFIFDKSEYPHWDQLVPWFDKSFKSGNKRARDPHKIFAPVHSKDFKIVEYITNRLRNVIKTNDISCHCYAGFSPNAKASPPHCDPMEVLYVQIAGSTPWKVFENGCDYDDKTQTMTSRSTWSGRLVRGHWVYMPTGVYHQAVPDESRVGFSFGWQKK